MKEVARPPRAGVVAVPVSLGTDIITRPTKLSLLDEVRRGTLAGEFGGVSAVHHVGGVWAVKVERLRPAPAPPPAWHRTAKIAGGIAVGVLLACAGVVAALAYLVETTTEAASRVPWETVAGVGFLAFVALLLAKKALTGSCSFTITHHH